MGRIRLSMICRSFAAGVEWLISMPSNPASAAYRATPAPSSKPACCAYIVDSDSVILGTASRNSLVECCENPVTLDYAPTRAQRRARRKTNDRNSAREARQRAGVGPFEDLDWVRL